MSQEHLKIKNSFLNKLKIVFIKQEIHHKKNYQLNSCVKICIIKKLLLKKKISIIIIF